MREIRAILRSVLSLSPGLILAVQVGYVQVAVLAVLKSAGIDFFSVLDTLAPGCFPPSWHGASLHRRNDAP